MASSGKIQNLAVHGSIAVVEDQVGVGSDGRNVRTGICQAGPGAHYIVASPQCAGPVYVPEASIESDLAPCVEIEATAGPLIGELLVQCQLCIVNYLDRTIAGRQRIGDRVVVSAGKIQDLT